MTFDPYHGFSVGDEVVILKSGYGDVSDFTKGIIAEKCGRGVVGIDLEDDCKYDRLQFACRNLAYPRKVR